MTIEILKRVIWRVRERNPGKSLIRRKEVEYAIMCECGTYEETIWENIKALKKLGWIRTERRQYRIYFDRVDST